MRTRGAGELRQVEIIPNYTEMATGSALICCGRTKVLCTASVSEGVPPFLRNTGRGWLTAEYAMLPGSTPERKQREYSKRDGRSVEIQRLIGRSLRSAVNLSMLGERTITIDCDVLQADGGTRTASITGGFVALCLAVDKLIGSGKLKDSPIVRQVAAVSCGLVDEQELLDLEYVEDSAAQADMNLVGACCKSGEIEFTEVQITGEKRTIKRQELLELMDMGESGIRTLMAKQIESLGDASRWICKKPRLVVASNNFGKIKEMKGLLSDWFEVVSMHEMGVQMDVDETGTTFGENALIKANALFAKTGCATIADDSGICVDALNGRPGVYSARYSGVDGDDAANNAKLCKELEGVPDEERTAHFVCDIALVRPGKAPLVVEGSCSGHILHEELIGGEGFGYDPLFLSDDIGITFAQATQEEKGKVSHRGRAVQALLRALEEEEE